MKTSDIRPSGVDRVRIRLGRVADTCEQLIATLSNPRTKARLRVRLDETRRKLQNLEN